jgi:phage FluMu protein gp41
MFRMVVGRPVKNSARDQLTTERELTPAETLDYGCAAEKLNDTLQKNNQSPKAMFKALGNLDLIRFRR